MRKVARPKTPPPPKKSHFILPPISPREPRIKEENKLLPLDPYAPLSRRQSVSQGLQFDKYGIGANLLAMNLSAKAQTFCDPFITANVPDEKILSFKGTGRVFIHTRSFASLDLTQNEKAPITNSQPMQDIIKNMKHSSSSTSATILEETCPSTNENILPTYDNVDVLVSPLFPLCTSEGIEPLPTTDTVTRMSAEIVSSCESVHTLSEDLCENIASATHTVGTSSELL